MCWRSDIDHIVPGVSYKTADPVGPQRRRHAAGVAAPIEAAENRSLQ